MDDLFKDIFNNNENKEVNPQEPIFENTDAPIIKSEEDVTPAPQAEAKPLYETPSEPVAPQVEAKPLYETPSEPVAPPAAEPTSVSPPTPPVSTPQSPVQNYTQPTPDRAVFYQPPIQSVTPPQTANNFDIPPAFNQNQRAPQTNIPPVQAPENPAYLPAKKNKSTARIVVIIIAVVAVVISITGLLYAANHDSSGSGSSSNIFEEFGKDDKSSSNDNDNTDDAQAEVKGSSSAEKKNKDGSYTVAGVVEGTKDSCVGITVYAEQDSLDDFGYFYGYGENQNSDGEVKSGEGSGVIMSEANGKTYIMTCAHVIEGGTKFTVTLDNDKEYDARYVGSDAQTDIGVLVIDATGLQVAEFGDSEDIEVGEDCVAIGCPGGLEFKNSVTKGIVSALAVPVESKIGYNNECIQIDAAINPGNSGGALFNMQGQVIGINSSKIASTEYEGMGFAVPSNTAVKTANSLIKDGYVKGRAKLGITYATLSMMTSDGGSQILSALEEKGFKKCEGAMIISEVDSESGLYGKVEKNDMIVAANGETMTSVDILTSILAKSKPGDTIKLTIARIEGNNIKTFEVSCKLIEAKE